MAENNGAAMMQQREQQFKCTKDCRNCPQQQRIYCACQHALSNMLVLDTMMGIVIAMQGEVKALSEKIEAIQNSEASVFDPCKSAADPAAKAGPAETI